MLTLIMMPWLSYRSQETDQYQKCVKKTTSNLKTYKQEIVKLKT